MPFSILSPSWRAKAPNLSTPTGDLVESEQQSPSPSAQLINKNQAACRPSPIPSSKATLLPNSPLGYETYCYIPDTRTKKTSAQKKT